MDPEEAPEIDLKKEKSSLNKVLSSVIEKEEKVEKRRNVDTKGVSSSINWNRLKAQIQKEDAEPKPASSKKKLKKREKKRKRKLERAQGNPSITSKIMHPEISDLPKGLTPIVALDCEMVEVDGYRDALARISVVSYNGHTLFDTFVKPDSRITNYRTWVSGVTPRHMEGAMGHVEARTRALKMLEGRKLVGHSLKNDFKVLEYEHPKESTRDTSHFKLL